MAKRADRGVRNRMDTGERASGRQLAQYGAVLTRCSFGGFNQGNRRTGRARGSLPRGDRVNNTLLFSGRRSKSSLIALGGARAGCWPGVKGARRGRKIRLLAGFKQKGCGKGSSDSWGEGGKVLPGAGSQITLWEESRGGGNTQVAETSYAGRFALPGGI